MHEPILVINAGSSSVKFSLFKAAKDQSLAASANGQVEGIGGTARLEVADAGGRKLVNQSVNAANHHDAIESIHGWLLSHVGAETICGGFGHRVVHGGLSYFAPIMIDERVISDLEKLIPLAPLHQPHNIAAIRALAKIAPNVPQVACFDTAFHHNQPEIAQRFALPRALTAKGIRRYGFHGLSYEYIVSALSVLAPECSGGKIVVAHLGSGASMCAIESGRSVATTMGFTPLDGLPMGTRSGSLDPGVILYLLDHEHMSAMQIQDLLYQRSGLFGVSGISNDMRDLLASKASAARDAIDLFIYRIGRELGSLVAALGGLDCFVFTAGIGEHAAEIRARVCRDARWLGVVLDEKANLNGGPRISAEQSPVSIWVVSTDENLMVARHTHRLLDGASTYHAPRPPWHRPV